MAKETQERPASIEEEPLGTPTRAMNDLLAEYVGLTGRPLARLPESQKKMRPDGVAYLWPWNWDPEVIAALLADWASPKYFLHPVMREVCTTISPDGRTMMYERCCRPAVKDAISNIINLGQAPVGAIRPVPKGTYSIDLTRCPPNTRPTIFTLNYWHFSGKVKDISKDVWEMLTMMHGAWFSEQWRAREGYENPTVNLGELR